MKNKTTTAHGLERAKERMDCNEKKAIRAIEGAINHGKRANDFKSAERDFLKKHETDNCIAVAYNKFCYIINELGACVTMYALPAWFDKKRYYSGKERIRNLKAYSRMNNFI